MAKLKPFRALRPPAALAGQLSAPPYDVVSRAEAARAAQGNPSSFFRISKPELEFEEEVDEHDDRVYTRGKENLGRFLREGWLAREDDAAFYLYEQQMGSHRQLGLVAAASVEEYEQGVIRRHELTRADKELDRTRHVEALDANDEPVFLTYRSSPTLDGLLARVCEAAPEYAFDADDGTRHTFWKVPSSLSQQIEEAFAPVDCLYIADGHHRSAAAARVHAARKAANVSGAHDRFLAVAFPHDQLKILGYHRLIRDLNGRTPEALLEELSRSFEVKADAAPLPQGPRAFGMYVKGRWYGLTARELAPQDAVEALDVSLLQNTVLSPLLGIGNPRTDARIQFVGGIRGTGELEKRVDSGECAVAFTLHPPSVEQMMAVADSGGIMPPKSTWFEPKLRSGLVLHPFDSGQ